ncbi:MAG TPA: hypothetical protein DEO36_10985, partial [Flavobacteriaceae bacterium]|nr:hypothetical protein [Flavobacteriaceae bacterium]
MIKKLNISIGILIFLFNSMLANAQGTLPVYTDYLSDNVFLLHPSAAGIGNCAKLRLTHRQQWSGVSEAPSLQTLSYHQRFNEKAAFGIVMFNDKNGYHAQKGISAAYAYHINFGSETVLNQLSFGLLGSFVQNTVDKSSFTSLIPDIVATQLIESDNYFNADFSVGYHYLEAFSYLTVKNLLLQTNNSGSRVSFKSLNLRSYLFTLGYYFGENSNIQFEPSIMVQYKERTGELTGDINVKMYKKLQGNQQICGGLSYRNSFEANSIESLGSTAIIV